MGSKRSEMIEEENMKNKNDRLMIEIAKWPNWKLQSLLLDESDLRLAKKIGEYRELHEIRRKRKK